MNRTIVLLPLLLAAILPASADDLPGRVLQEINLARTDPSAYAGIVAQSASATDPRATREAVDFLRRARPLQPLRWSEAMSAGALLHVLQQGHDGGMWHVGRGRSRSWDRLSEFGEWKGAVGENIHYGPATARGIVVALIVDAGVRGRGHRKNIFTPAFNVAGVAQGSHSRFGAMCVINFAGDFIPDSSASAGRGDLAQLAGASRRDL